MWLCQARNTAEVAKLRDHEKRVREETMAELAQSHRPEFTAPGSMPNYLPTRDKATIKSKIHTGMSLKAREEKYVLLFNEINALMGLLHNN